MFKRKTKIKVVFLIPTGKGNYEKVGEKKIKAGIEQHVRWEGKVYPITVKSYSFIAKKTPITFIDVSTRKTLIFKEKDIGLNPEFLDRFLTTSKVGIIGQLVHAFKIMESQKTDWGALGKPIIIFVLGAVIGFFVGGGTIG